MKVERSEELAFANQFRTDGETFQVEESIRQAERKRQMQLHQAQLLEQINAKKARDTSAMSEAERRLNAALLAKVSKDPVFMRKIADRLNGVRPGTSGI